MRTRRVIRAIVRWRLRKRLHRRSHKRSLQRFDTARCCAIRCAAWVSTDRKTSVRQSSQAFAMLRTIGLGLADLQRLENLDVFKPCLWDKKMVHRTQNNAGHWQRPTELAHSASVLAQYGKPPDPAYRKTPVTPAAPLRAAPLAADSGHTPPCSAGSSRRSHSTASAATGRRV